MLLTKLIHEKVQEESVVAWFYTMSYRYPLPEENVHHALKQPITHIELHESGYPRINLPVTPMAHKTIQILDVVIRIFDCDTEFYVDVWTNANDLSPMMHNGTAYNQYIISAWLNKAYYYSADEQDIISLIHSLITSRVMWLERNALKEARHEKIR